MRVTQAGLISPQSVMRAAYVCLALAAVCGIPLIIRGGWPLLTIGVFSILAAYAYTGGPFPLAYHGLGELFVLVFFGIVAVGGTYYLLELDYGVEVFLAGVATGLLSVAILAINNLRDIHGDRISNKRTVAVRIGETAARVEIALSALIPFAIVAAIAVVLADRRLFLPLLAAPIAIVLIVRVYRSTGVALNRCLAIASMLLWGFSLLFVVAVLI
jgi:1,4-dihydroxy-2-naphthoate octaprenyltransferase